jgi:hypothetical protein
LATGNTDKQHASSISLTTDLFVLFCRVRKTPVYQMHIASKNMACVQRHVESRTQIQVASAKTLKDMVDSGRDGFVNFGDPEVGLKFCDDLL